MRNTKINEMTTSKVINWPSRVSIRMLLNVGDGVSEFKNFTSESQDGCRCLPDLVVEFTRFESLGLADDESPGKNKTDSTFLKSESITGSPVGKLNIDGAGVCNDGKSVAADPAVVEDEARLVRVIAASIALPLGIICERP